MKQLYWTRIQIPNPSLQPAAPSTSNTPLIWEEVEDVVVEGAELEDMFGKADLKTKAKEPKVEEKKVEKVAKIIDGKKSQNLGIFLKSKKIDVELIKQVLFECDTSCEMETLVQLQGFKASPEDELPALREHVKTKPELPLDTPDQFLYELSEVHMLDQRLACLLFQATFSGLCDDVATRLDYINTSCSFLLNNKKLRKLLGVILGRFIGFAFNIIVMLL